MPVFVHPLEELCRETGFSVPSIRVLVHFLVLLQQWKINLSIHRSDLFEAEISITRATVSFFCLCELYLKTKFNIHPSDSDSSSKSVPFIISSNTIKGKDLSPSTSLDASSIEENEFSKTDNSFFPLPVFISDISHDLILSLIDAFSKTLGYGAINPAFKEYSSTSPEELFAPTEDKTLIGYSNSFSPQIRPLSCNISSQSQEILPNYSPTFCNPSFFSPLLSSTSSLHFPMHGHLQLSPNFSSFSSSFKFATLQSDNSATEPIIKNFVEKVQKLAELLQTDFFGSLNSNNLALPLKFDPSVKVLLEALDKEAMDAVDFPGLISIFKSILLRTRPTYSILQNYISFFTIYPNPPFSSFLLPPSLDEPVPDYVRNVPLHHASLIDFWWYRYKLGPSERFSLIASKLSEYLKENDSVAYTLWSNYMASPILKPVLVPKLEMSPSELLWYPEDLALDANQFLSIADLAQIFPCDTVYNTSIGDWILWRLFGWLYLALETENKIYDMRKKVPLAEHERSVVLIQTAMNQLRCRFGYTKEIHKRLTVLYIKLIYKPYPTFSLRFQQILRFLNKVHSQIQEILSKPFLHASDSHAWAQVWALVRQTILQWNKIYSLCLCAGSLQDDQRLGDCTHMMDQVVQQAKPLALRFFINPLSLYRSPSGYLWMHLNVNTSSFAIAPSSPRLILDPMSLSKICQAMSITHPHIELIYGVTVLNGHWHLVTESSEPIDLYSKSAHYESPSTRVEMACNILSAGWALSCSGLYLQSPIQLISVNQVPKLKMSDLNLWISADYDNSTLTMQPNPEVYFRFIITKLFTNSSGKVFPQLKALVEELNCLWMERSNIPGHDRDGSYFFRHAGHRIMEYRIPKLNKTPPIQSFAPNSSDSFKMLVKNDNPNNDSEVQKKLSIKKNAEGISHLMNKDPTIAPSSQEPIQLENDFSSMSLVSNKENPLKMPTVPSAEVPLVSCVDYAETTPNLPLTYSESSRILPSNPNSPATSVSSASSIILPPLPELLPRQSQFNSSQPYHAIQYPCHPLQSHLRQPSAIPSYGNSLTNTSVNAKSANASSLSPSTSSTKINSSPTIPSAEHNEKWKKALQFFKEGQGDVSAAFNLFKEVAIQFPLAYFYMAESLYFGSKIYNFEQDPYQAFSYYQKALSAGCAIAHVGLGDCLYFGFSGRRDLTQAQHHYMQVLKLTPLPPKLRSRAWAGLGDCQFDIGDYVTALDAYLNATQLDISMSSKTQPSKRAYSRLALMYIHGKGVKKDLEKAKMYLKHSRLCRREVLVKSEWFRANAEPRKADAYLEEYLWRFPIDY